MRRFSKTARKELETIKDILNEFGHGDARSFSFERIRDLANNLFFECARGISPRCVQARSGEPGKWRGEKPPADQKTAAGLPPIASGKLAARERYLRACQFFSGALLFVGYPRNGKTLHYF
jgi:hypothetical protein